MAERRNLKQLKTGFLHFTSAPVVGGVEEVMQAHAVQFSAAGIPLTIIAGRGAANALPAGVSFTCIDEIDTLHPEISQAAKLLAGGTVPASFTDLVERLAQKLRKVLPDFDHLIVHNVFTKGLNLPLTAALHRLLDEGILKNVTAWCHDLSWASTRSSHEMYPEYPWTLLKKAHPQVRYVVPSGLRQRQLAEITGSSPEQIRVISNGVDPKTLLALSHEGAQLIERMKLLESGLILLMPVRVTNAKNIEFALQVLAELKKTADQPKIVLTGPPDPHDPVSRAYFEQLRSYRSELGLENDLHFVYELGPPGAEGYQIGNTVVADLYRVSDVMFMPSHYEGFGMPVLEAALAGVPVISTPVPAIADHARGDTLVFSPDIRPEELTRRIVDWMDQRPEHRLRVRVRRRFTWHAIFLRDILPLLQGGQ